MCLHRSGRGAVRFFEGAQVHPKGNRGEQPSGSRNLYAFRRIQTVRGRIYGNPYFTKTEAGGTDHVWFYDMQNDGLSLDDKRSPIEENDIPDIIRRFHHLDGEMERKRTEQSFMVPKEDIVENDYDLSINKYKEVEYVPVEYPSTQEILTNLREIEMEIATAMDELTVMLGED